MQVRSAKDSGDFFRLADDAFAKICNSVNDLSVTGNPRLSYVFFVALVCHKPELGGFYQHFKATALCSKQCWRITQLHQLFVCL